MRWKAWKILSMAGGCLLAACGTDAGFAPEDIIGVSGVYEATTLRISNGGTTRSVLDEGGSLQLELRPGGERLTEGRLVVPGGLEADGGDLEASLEGSWEATVGAAVVVRFDFVEDVFLEDLRFLATPGKLEAEQTLDGTTYSVVLEQLRG